MMVLAQHRRAVDMVVDHHAKLTGSLQRHRQDVHALIRQQPAHTAERARARGDYRTATREYLKALDGAGDDAADIHYQLGRCYQFLEENDSAISHYTDAITEYKRIASSGKNADEANRQIKRCEAGIRACQ